MVKRKFCIKKTKMFPIIAMNFVQEHLKISEIVQEQFKTAPYILNIRYKIDKKTSLKFW